MLADDGTASGQVVRLIGSLSLWCDLLGNLISQCSPLCQSTTQGSDIAFVPFPSLRLRCQLGRIRQRRSRGQPESHKECQSLVRNGDMTLEPLDLTRESVQTTAKRPLQPLGSIRRQEGRKSRLHDQRLRDALAQSVVGELAGQIGWQAKGVLGPHLPALEIESVARIHRRL